MAKLNSGLGECPSRFPQAYMGKRVHHQFYVRSVTQNLISLRLEINALGVFAPGLKDVRS
jgi:hypothetical protein